MENGCHFTIFVLAPETDPTVLYQSLFGTSAFFKINTNLYI